MSNFSSGIIRLILKQRLRKIERIKKQPGQVQQETFKGLLQQAKYTVWGKHYHFRYLKSGSDFSDAMPLSTYESLYPWIERVLKGEANVMWPTPIRWFSKSSGTTNDRSKFIPVSVEALKGCHYQGGKDLVALYYQHNPKAKALNGRNLGVGGSMQKNELHRSTSSASYIGDVSAIIMQNLPMWAQARRTPSLKTALMPNWDQKIAKLAEESIPHDVTALTGVPTWMLMVLRHILTITGADNIHQVWPNLEIFMHGAVAFGPYRDAFKELLPGHQMHFQESYNASEGFFAVQDDLNLPDEMLLMLDYGIYYEFIPLSELDSAKPLSFSISEVEVGINYAMVISTNAGLWRYLTGDTIRFTSTYPHRIKITGRTKHFINAFGEEIVVENADRAIEEACRATGAIIEDYTAAPIYLTTTNKGGHEWVFEFNKEPSNLQLFAQVIDNTLKAVNTDYEAKRSFDIAILPPVIRVVACGTFKNWMREKGKMGGQHKVPRLSNNRDIVNQILAKSIIIAAC